MGRYVDSVPKLKAEERVAGFVWEIRNFVRSASGQPVLPPGVTYIGGTAGAAILAATAVPHIDCPAPLQAQPWKLQACSDSAQTIPFATLDDGGRYAHLESFKVPLDTPDDLPDLVWCTFLCGATDEAGRGFAMGEE